MELFRALGALIEAPATEHSRVAEALGLPSVPAPAVHGSVVAFQRYPYASVYLGREGMMGGEARDRITGFRRALGIGGAASSQHSRATRPVAEGDDRFEAATGQSLPGHATEADHLASLLALLAALDRWRDDEPGEARAALLEQARVTLVWEHIVSWTGPYLTSFDRCGAPFYGAWAALLGEALERLCTEMALPGYLPAALREAPPLADPRTDGGEAFIASLLAPVRSGVILLRDDLTCLGDETGMVCRAGERRYVLQSFFAQDPGATLKWLAGHAREWSGRVVGWGPAPIARWWSERSAESASLLSRLGDAAGAVVGAGGMP